MASSIIHGKHLVKRARGDSSEVITDGAFYQKDGTIIDVGPYQDLKSRYPGETDIGGDSFLVIPGLVNSHHHGHGITSLQIGGLDDQLEYWMVGNLGHKAVDPYLDTLYASMKLLRSGVTTVMFNFSQRLAKGLREDCDRVLEAFGPTGQRVAFSLYLENQYRIVAEDEGRFLSRLPSDLAARVKVILDENYISDDDYLSLFQSLHQDHNDGYKVNVLLSPANVHWCSDRLLTRMRELATQYHTGIHIHLAESIYEKLIGLKLYGKTPLQHLKDLGFLGPEVSLAHAVWLTREDLDIVGENGLTICHNPSSNLRLKSGIAPVSTMVARGLDVAIGTDSSSINEDEDLLQEMRLAHKLHRPPGVSSPSLDSHQILKMATVNGARATLFEDIGALEEGKRADAVLIRLGNLVEPYLDPDISIVDALIYRGRATDVDTVIIDGKVMLQGGEFVDIDEAAVMKELSEILKRPPTDKERANQQTVQELMPYVTRFYERWNLGELRPYFAYNSSV
ncbi:MAG: amidohydrolase family protein [Chloroflexi bacterium]|nr:amidohydrolase family protein [Chloroflexota bacterium]